MNLVFFCHPAFMRSQSMPRFARMIGEAMRERGHHVSYWAPDDHCHRRFVHTRLEKWAGYIDQYILFPIEVRRRLAKAPPDTLYVLCDQALGPWVPLVSHLPHVVHAHDLLALRSALGLIPENRTGFTGRLYQRYIRWGFRQAQHFISVSQRTKQELAQYGGVRPKLSEVVYNGMNHPYRPMPEDEARTILHQHTGMAIGSEGLLLHIGGGQWYKNTQGVLQLYAAYAHREAKPLPLLMVSPAPTSDALQAALASIPPQGRVTFVQGADNDTIRAAYSLAQAFLFPSLAEGFGWPIIEAQACGCPVITTDDAPMNEIGGPLAHYLPLLRPGMDIRGWAEQGADLIARVIRDGEARDAVARQTRMQWASRFSPQQAIDGYERLYQQILQRSPR